MRIHLFIEGSKLTFCGQDFQQGCLQASTVYENVDCQNCLEVVSSILYGKDNRSAVRFLKRLAKGDPEKAHLRVDGFLAWFLDGIGHEKLARAYQETTKKFYYS